MLKLIAGSQREFKNKLKKTEEKGPQFQAVVCGCYAGFFLVGSLIKVLRACSHSYVPEIENKVYENTLIHVTSLLLWHMFGPFKPQSRT